MKCYPTTLLGLASFLLVCFVLSQRGTSFDNAQKESYRLLMKPQSPQEVQSLIQLDKKDIHRLLNLTDFQWKLDGIFPSGCSQRDPPLVLIFIHSAPGNYKRRKIIRETWGKKRKRVVLRFMVGLTDNATQERLEEENRVNVDIVQGTFQDTYRNLTYKYVMGMKWVTYFCPMARYVLKTDDDALVNIFELLYHLEYRLSPLGARNLLMCEISARLNVMRSYRSKWRMTYSEYQESTYPTFCAGYAVLYSPDVVFRLYKEAQKSSFIWIDDVQVTGLLVKKIGVRHVEWGTWLMPVSSVPDFLSGSFNRPFIIAPVDIPVETKNQIWSKIDLYYNSSN